MMCNNADGSSTMRAGVSKTPGSQTDRLRPPRLGRSTLTDGKAASNAPRAAGAQGALSRAPQGRPPALPREDHLRYRQMQLI
eukprot:1806720-Prymnesium_polylepis.1